MCTRVNKYFVEVLGQLSHKFGTFPSVLFMLRNYSTPVGDSASGNSLGRYMKQTFAPTHPSAGWFKLKAKNVALIRWIVTGCVTCGVVAWCVHAILPWLSRVALDNFCFSRAQSRRGDERGIELESPIRVMKWSLITSLETYVTNYTWEYIYTSHHMMWSLCWMVCRLLKAEVSANQSL